TSAGTLTSLHAFLSSAHADGIEPTAPLLQSSDGDFYGTTFEGTVAPVHGTVFRLTLCTYTVSTASLPAGGGSVSGGGSFHCDTNVTVCALPDSCYTFVNWTENSNAVGSLSCYT